MNVSGAGILCIINGLFCGTR